MRLPRASLSGVAAIPSLGRTTTGCSECYIFSMNKHALAYMLRSRAVYAFGATSLPVIVAANVHERLVKQLRQASPQLARRTYMTASPVSGERSVCGANEPNCHNVKRKVGANKSPRNSGDDHIKLM